MQKEDRETARPGSVSSYSEICPLIGLSAASIFCGPIWFWLVIEFEHEGLSTLDNCINSSFTRLKLCLHPWKVKHKQANKQNALTFLSNCNRNVSYPSIQAMPYSYIRSPEEFIYCIWNKSGPFPNKWLHANHSHLCARTLERYITKMCTLPKGNGVCWL